MSQISSVSSGSKLVLLDPKATKRLSADRAAALEWPLPCSPLLEMLAKVITPEPSSTIQTSFLPLWSPGMRLLATLSKATLVPSLDTSGYSASPHTGLWSQPLTTPDMLQS